MRRYACAAGVHTPARPAHSCLQGALLHEQFDAVAADRPDAVCLVDDATGVSLTYREVAEAVDTLAAALAKLGVTRDIGEHWLLHFTAAGVWGCIWAAMPVLRTVGRPACLPVHPAAGTGTRLQARAPAPSPLTRGSHVRPASQLWASWWIARPRW